MRKFISYALALLPSLLHVLVRRLLGAKIGKGAKIRWGTVLSCRTLEMGANSKIGPFTYLDALDVRLGEGSTISPLSFTVCAKLSLGAYSQIAPMVFIKGSLDPKSRLSVGDHSKIFTFCFLEPGEGITIGKQVGIGGLGLLFTHGSWVNYLNGGPLRFAPITIEDNVWIPWRCMIFPGVTIGENSIVVVPGIIRRSIPANTCVAAPAVEVIKPYEAKRDPDTLQSRAQEILQDYGERLRRIHGENLVRISERCVAFESKIVLQGTQEELSSGDLLIVLDSSLHSKEIERSLNLGISVLHHPTLTLYRASAKGHIDDFLDYLLRWGIRLYVKGATSSRGSLSFAPTLEPTQGP